MLCTDELRKKNQRTISTAMKQKKIYATTTQRYYNHHHHQLILIRSSHIQHDFHTYPDGLIYILIIIFVFISHV